MTIRIMSFIRMPDKGTFILRMIPASTDRANAPRIPDRA